MTQVTVAVVGVGRFGQEHLQTYQQLPDVRVVGVVDTDAGLVTSVADRYAVRAFSDVRTLMAEVAPDAVSIAVHAQHHPGILADLADHDCAVLVEKPLAVSSTAAMTLLDRPNSHRVMVGHILRFTPQYAVLRELVRATSGPMHGDSTRIRPADHLVDYPEENIVGLTMIHDLDALLWVTGERVRTVQAQGHRNSNGRWYYVDAALELSGGSTWTCRARWDGNDDDSMSVAGATVRICSDSSELIAPDGTIVTYPGASTTYDQALKSELAHFVECARTGQPSPIFSLEDAAAAVVVADAILTSLGKGGEKIVLA